MSNPIGDRNLLFGILAVKKDIISGDTFVAAMKVWSADKKKGLAQILREQNAITENHHAVLEEQVDQSLAKYDHDTHQCLATFNLAGPAREGLEQLGDADVSVGLAQVPVEPPKPAAAPAKTVEPVSVKTPGPVNKPKPQKAVPPIPKAPPRPAGISGWVLLGCGATFGIVVVVIGAAAVIGMLFFWLAPHPAGVPKGEAIAQEKPDQGKPKGPDLALPVDKPKLIKPPAAEPEEPIVIKPPVDKPEDPVGVKPPVVKNQLRAEFILELPRPAGRAVLSADGQRVAYTTSNIGSFDHREAPAFDQIKTTIIDGVLTAVHPLASSPDGKKMTLAAGTKDGPKVFVWNWQTTQVEKTFSFPNLAISNVFSANGRLMATYFTQTPEGQPVEHWLHVHAIFTGRTINQWQLNAEPNFFGFTPDNNKVFVATKGDQAVRAFALDGGGQSLLPFAQPAKKYAFARDFSKFAYIEAPTQVQLGFVDGVRSLGKLDTNKESNHIKIAAYSPDNRFLLLGIEDVSKHPVLAGKAMLVDLASGKTVALTDELQGFPDRAELAANGVGLLQGQNLRPRLYRFSIAPVEAVVKAPAGPTPGFVQLFNGKDLTGWMPTKIMAGNWRVENGILLGTASGKISGRLVSAMPRSRDFHLRVEARLQEKGTGFVYVRCPDESLFGTAAIMNGSFLDQKISVGGLVSHVPGRSSSLPQLDGTVLPFGEWLVLDIIAEGDRVRLKVNGKATADVLDPANVRAGHVILLAAPNSTIEFRRIEVKELNFIAAPPPIAADGFVSLFNGKDLTGWKPHAQQPGDWRVVNGILTGKAVGPGYLFTVRDDYQDYHLRLEARVKPGGSSDLMFRYALDFQGYEARIADKITGHMTVRSKTGVGNGRAILSTGFAPPEPPGEWIPMEIIAEGNRVRLKINGFGTVNFVDNKNNFRSGHIGMRDLNGCIEFRKIEIKELNLVAAPPPPPLPAEDGFVPLFNGKDLTGWKSNRTAPGDWRVIDGILTGSGPNLRELYTPRDDYGDFHLRLEGRINDDGNGFVVVRYPHGPAELKKMAIGGYAARISSRPVELIRTGSLFVYDGFGVRTLAFKEPLAPAGQWFNMEIIAKGNLVVVKVNGRETKSFLNPKDQLLGGRIVLGFSDTTRKTVMEYRKIEIKEFKAVAAAPPPAARRLAAYVPLLNGKDMTGWRVEGAGTWKVTPDGDLISQGPEAGLLTNRRDFKNFNVKIEMSASADVEGFLAFRQNPGAKGKWLGLTSRLTGDGALVRAGFVGIDSANKETGSILADLKPGTKFKLEFQVEETALRAFASGRATGGLTFAPDRHPAGAIGLYIAQGTVRIHKFEVAEELPDAPLPVAAGEFVPLFNGKDLTGWKPHQDFPGVWRVENGVLIGAAPGKTVARLHTVEPRFKNFHLRVEARGGDKSLGTIGFRYPDGGLPGYNATVNGLKPEGIKVGGLTAQIEIERVGKGIVLPALSDVLVPRDRWFTLEIMAQGNRLIILADGKKTTDTADETYLAAGYISLGLFGPGTIEFRKVEIRELKPADAAPPPPPEPPAAQGIFAPLFNGKDLTGWLPHAKRPGNWRVENGILIGSAPNGSALYSTRNDYQDFYLRAEIRINDKGFGRVFARAAYDPAKIPSKVIGYEALINQRPLGDKTGTLTATSLVNQAMTRARESPAPAGEWFLLEVVATGDLVTVKVNGVAVADFQDLKKQFARSGHIALLQDANAVIEFRKVEIDERPAR